MAILPQILICEIDMKYEIVHVDTCLPDYWHGHHLMHLSIPVWHGMSLQNIKDSLISELSQNAICGYIPDEWQQEGNEYELSEYGYSQARDCINALTPINPEQIEFFTDIENDETGEFPVYAYFVFVEIKD